MACPRSAQPGGGEKDRIEIKQQVHFATNKSKILSDSFALLNQVVQAIIFSFKIHVEGTTTSGR